MSEVIKPYTAADISALVRTRPGEVKAGERADFVRKDWREEISRSEARYVVVGIPEDIGVRANHGRPGAATAFRPALDSLLNQQDNRYMPGNDLFILGEVMVEDLMREAAAITGRDEEAMRSLRTLVPELDRRVEEVIRTVLLAGKFPVVIGGGHNNAYGCIHASFNTHKKPVNVINCDPHLDFRQQEGRHSGNAFSAAFDAGWIKRYAVVCMHEQYNNAHAVETFITNPRQLHYSAYESVFVREELTFRDAVLQSIGFTGHGPCGVELDLDAITNVPSSARTSSGISPVQARSYLHLCATHLHSAYLHIAEGAPVLSHIRADNKTGKLIAYLVSDFIKARGNAEHS